MEEQLLYPSISMKSNLFNQSFDILKFMFSWKTSVLEYPFFGIIFLHWLDDVEVVWKTRKHHIT